MRERNELILADLIADPRRGSSPTSTCSPSST